MVLTIHDRKQFSIPSKKKHYGGKFELNLTACRHWVRLGSGHYLWQGGRWKKGGHRI